MYVTKKQLKKATSEFQNNPTKENKSKFELYSESSKFGDFLDELGKKIYGEGK